MSIAEEFQQQLQSEAKELIDRFVAECTETRRPPDIVWKGHLMVSQPWIFGKRRKKEWHELAGWTIPGTDSSHWILEDGAWCWIQTYVHGSRSVFGRLEFYGTTVELSYERVNRLTPKVLRSIIRGLKAHFASLPN